MATAVLEIRGMSCGHCVKAVQQALAGVAGVTTETVAVGSATVHFAPEQSALAEVTAAVEAAGYPVTAVTQSA